MNKVRRVIKGLALMLNHFKKNQKANKMERFRRHVINEILFTELNYINDLGVLEELRETLRNELTIKSDEQYINKIFMNVSDIRQENQKFYDQIKSKTVNLNANSVIFNNVDVQGFETYYSYCRNYNESLKALKQLLQKQPQLEYSLKNRQNMRGLQIVDFLVKPVQRLPKYILFWKELKKGTRNNHPDMENILGLQQEFERLNEENNKSMDKFMNRARVMELSKEYEDDSIYQENEDRLIIYEDIASIIKEGKELNVIFYIFTDIVLIGYQEQESKTKKAMKFKLDSQTIVKDQLDTKYFTNLFSIVIQENVIQFTAQNKEIKEKSIKQIQKIINYIKERSQLQDIDPITVKVVGTEERFSYSINKYTIYIVEIEIDRIVLKIYIRFSRALELLNIFKQRYPDGTFEDISSYHWLNNHSTKVIEERMIAIEKMIQQVLILNQKQPEKLQPNEQSILSLLSLPDNFYELPKLNKKVDIEIKRQFKSYLKKPEQKVQQGVSDILDAYFSARNSQIRVSTIQETNVAVVTENYREIQQKNGKIIDVYLIDNQCEKIYIQEITRAAEIVKVLAQQMQLKYYQDFKLILEDKYLNRRVIDDDEVILQLHKISVNGILNSSINKIEQFWTNSNEEKLLFRKVIYLDPKYEFVEIYQDWVRMQYLVLQFFEEIRELKFLLNRQKLFLYIAFYLIIKKQDVKYENIQKYLKSEIFDQIEPKEWEMEVKKYITQINSQLLQLETEKKSMVYLCQYQFLKNIYYEKEATMNIYKLEVHRELQATFSKLKILDIKGNIYIGLSQQKISLLTPLDKKVIQEIQYQEIDNIQSFPNKLVIRTKQNKPEKGWKFITFQSFEIKMLINFYKELSLNES
ncbi:unnamed protein product [Paramecium pentaurelia]|uniref:DH domain-containing protein n=1 Tax=Paramecium pentaurelia TaxID=43138 RepID=A0A8S1Y782_9CILI|nr:unnamed protein product [Paramecium pentaurelia]